MAIVALYIYKLDFSGYFSLNNEIMSCMVYMYKKVEGKLRVFTWVNNSSFWSLCNCGYLLKCLVLHYVLVLCDLIYEKDKIVGKVIYSHHILNLLCQLKHVIMPFTQEQHTFFPPPCVVLYYFLHQSNISKLSFGNVTKVLWIYHLPAFHSHTRNCIF